MQTSDQALLKWNLLVQNSQEKREAKIASESRGGKHCRIKNKTVGWAKTLWRAFQFAFGVYTFAGGQDDRADKITRELGNEIELILNNE